MPRRNPKTQAWDLVMADIAPVMGIAGQDAPSDIQQSLCDAVDKLYNQKLPASAIYLLGDAIRAAYSVGKAAP